MRKLILVVLMLLPGLALAQNDHHRATSTGALSNYCGPYISGVNNSSASNAYEDSSDVFYYEPETDWVVIEQHGIGIWEAEGACTNNPKIELDWQGCRGAPGLDQSEAAHPVGPAGSTWDNIVIVQNEDNPGFCTIDMDELYDGTPSDPNIGPATGYAWTSDSPCTSSPGTSHEGVAFIPSRNCEDCRYGGYIVTNNQTTRQVWFYRIDDTAGTLDCVKGPFTMATCQGNSTIDSWKYDFEEDKLYVNSNTGNCYVDNPIEKLLIGTDYTYDGQWAFPTIFDANQTMNLPDVLSIEPEGFAFGGGKFAYASDYTDGNNAYNGLWVFEDLYCGDNIISGTEVCDGTALDGETCASQGAGSGTLLCDETCDGYSTLLCDPPTALTDSPIYMQTHLPRYDGHENVGEHSAIVALPTTAAETGYPTGYDDTNTEVWMIVHDNWYDFGPGGGSTAPNDPDYTTIMGNEDWFYHDSDGYRIAVYQTLADADCDPATCDAGGNYLVSPSSTNDCDCRWALDRGNPELQQFVADRYADWVVAGGSWGGTTPLFGFVNDNTGTSWYFRDSRLPTGSGHVSARPHYLDPKTGTYDLEQTIEQWEEDTRRFLKAAAYGVGADNLYLYSGCYSFYAANKATGLNWINETDGCIVEAYNPLTWFDEDTDFGQTVQQLDPPKFYGRYGVDPGDPDPVDWPGDTTIAELQMNYGAAMLVVENAGQVWMTYQRALWGVDGAVGAAYDITPAEHVAAMPYLYVDIGMPTDDYTVEGTGIYSRPFDTGIVLVNPEGTAQNYTLPAGNYLKVDDTVVSGTVSVPSEEAFILREQPAVTVTVDYDTDNGTFVAKGSGHTGNVDHTPQRPDAAFLETNLGNTSWRSDYLNATYTRNFDVGTPQFTYTKLCDVFAKNESSSYSCDNVATGTPWTGTDSTYWKTNVCSAYATWATSNGFEDAVWDIWNEPNTAPIFKVGGTGAFTGQNFAATWRDCVGELDTVYTGTGDTLKVAGPAMSDGILSLAGFLFVDEGLGHDYMDASGYYLWDSIVYEAAFGWMAYLDYFDTQMDVLSIHFFGDEKVMDWEEQITILKGAMIAELDVGETGELSNLVAQWGADLSGLEIVVTEVFGTTGDRLTCDGTYVIDSIVPGHVVVGLGELHEADVDWMTRACWPDPSDCSDGCAGKTLSNLLIQDTANAPSQDPDQERAVWWVYDYYSDMADLAGQEAPVSSDYARVHGVAADDDATTFSAMVGFTHMDNNGDSTLQTESFDTLEIVMEGLGADCTVASATIKHISPTDYEAQFDEGDLTVNSTGNVTISGGSTTITVDDFDANDVVYVTVDTAPCAASTRRVMIVN